MCYTCKRILDLSICKQTFRGMCGASASERSHGHAHKAWPKQEGKMKSLFMLCKAQQGKEVMHLDLVKSIHASHALTGNGWHNIDLSLIHI